jgi:hypothetical protein
MLGWIKRGRELIRLEEEFENSVATICGRLACQALVEVCGTCACIGQSFWYGRARHQE